MSDDRATNLLRAIQQSAVDGSVNLATLLRQSRILAARLQYDPLKDWVNHESSGYPTDDVPPYRIIRGVESRGTFLGPFGQQLSNALIPPQTMPDHEISRGMSVVNLRDGVAFYEQLLIEAASQRESTLKQPWPSELLAFMSQRIYQGMNCVEAWQVFPTSSVAGMLDAVRNALLTFSLEIEELNPNAGEAAPGTLPVPRDSVAKLYNEILMRRLGQSG